jgi:hypothetical protein
LGGKSDIKAAYRRISLHGETAEKCTIMFNDIGLTSLRLTFGGSPCPKEFCIASELCPDLANDILHCPEWDPNVISSPHVGKLQDQILLDRQIHFAQARELDVDIPNVNWGRVDNFIDDGIVIIPDLQDNRNHSYFIPASR